MCKMTERKVLVYGSLNMDHVYSVEHFVRPGETLAADNLRITCGGKGLNQAVAFAKAGAKTYLAGKTGTGGDRLWELCREYGVHTEHLIKEELPGGHAIIQVDQKGQNSILIFGGTNQMQKEEEIDQTLRHFGQGDFLVLQNEINQLPYLIQKAWEHKMEIVLNPSPWHSDLLECGLSRISWLILNEVEAWQMTGEKEPGRIMEYFQKHYPEMKVVLTLGEEGALCQKEGVCIKASCCKTTVADTTGAGDTFTGYFFAEILRGSSVEKALETASKAAAIAVSRKGAAEAIPFLKEVVE